MRPITDSRFLASFPLQCESEKQNLWDKKILERFCVFSSFSREDTHEEECGSSAVETVKHSLHIQYARRFLCKQELLAIYTAGQKMVLVYCTAPAHNILLLFCLFPNETKGTWDIWLCFEVASSLKNQFAVSAFTSPENFSRTKAAL